LDADFGENAIHPKTAVAKFRITLYAANHPGFRFGKAVSSTIFSDESLPPAAYDAREVANFVLDHGDALGLSVSNMAVNKIVFFSHAAFLSLQNKPLILQRFEAWEWGPVVQDLYHAFKKFDDAPIVDRATKLDRATARYVVCEYRFAANDLDLLREVVDFYIRIPAIKLSDMSHVEGGPWFRVWHHEGKSNPGMLISNTSIREHYVGEVRHYWSSDAHPPSSVGATLRSLHQP
jgi:uncharacterized phage-associated protein